MRHRVWTIGACIVQMRCTTMLLLWQVLEFDASATERVQELKLLCGSSMSPPHAASVWKQHEGDSFLYSTGAGITKKWLISHAEDKGTWANDWARSEAMEPGSLPINASKWELKTSSSSSSWEKQQLQVRFRLEPPEERFQAHVVPNSSWTQTSYCRRSMPCYATITDVHRWKSSRRAKRRRSCTSYELY